MKLSYRWLARHVDLDGVSPEEVARLLTLHVAEVEGTEPFAPQLDAVTVGHVQNREQHPDADKLSVCTVDVGDAEPLQIVCGAPNVGAGQRVAVATVGTVLPGEFKIKKSKIRGVESRGMICSVRELDLGDEHDGIWVLPPASDGEPARVGTPVREALGLADTVFEIDNKAITHRPDLWGHRGFARELAALLGRALRPLDGGLPETGGGTAPKVTIESERCSRYLALRIDGLRVEPSPLWMQMLLLAAGQRPLDLLVDVSNFVQLDLGQPNHLFDRRRVSEGIEVRQARAGETMTTLDGIDRQLTEEDLLICSGGRAVALAGVMGGEESAVASDTTSLLLEVANFSGVHVRRTAARLGLRTDASARFEKGLDPTLVETAAAHLVRLLAEIQPSLSLPAPPTDAGDWRPPSATVELDPDAVRGLLGVDVSDERIASLLEGLEFGVERGSLLRVTVPSFRAGKDVTAPEDLIEEVGRSLGYHEIPGRKLLAEVAPPERSPMRELRRRIQDRLAGAGRFREALGYTFVSDDLVGRVREADRAYVEVINPVVEGEARVRRGVVPSLLEKVAKNLRVAGEVRLFEIGKGYLPECADDRGEPGEVTELGLVLARPRAGAGARFDDDAFAHLRGVLDDLLGTLDVEFGAWRAAEAELPGWAHPGASVELPGSTAPVAQLARLDPRVARELELDADVAAARLSLDELLRLPPRTVRYRPVPRFPGVKLDVALSGPDATGAAAFRALIEQAGKGLVADAELFDLYRGESVGEGRKSLAYHVVLQADDRTLEDKDQAKFLDRLARSAERIGLELRRE